MTRPTPFWRVWRHIISPTSGFATGIETLAVFFDNFAAVDFALAANKAGGCVYVGPFYRRSK